MRSSLGIWLPLAALLWLSTSAFSQPPAATPETKTVRLTIDYGDGVRKQFTRLAWKPDLTVLGVLEQAQKHPRGIKFSFRGSKSTAFLYQIDDLKNRGRGRNWIFEVNGKLGKRSFAVTPLVAGDAVLWKFDHYKP